MVILRRVLAPIAACALFTGCGAAATAPTNFRLTPDGAATAAGGLQVTPLRDGYLRGDANGLRLWGEKPWELSIAVQANATIAAASSDPKMLTVSADRAGRGRFALQAVTATGASSTCAACAVVHPGTVDLLVTVSVAGKAPARYRVPVTIAHKIVAVSLNPMPNPSIGGSDAVLQYYDDNASPSVIWDDFDLHNATSFPNVTGMAFGADGSLYVANSGVSGVSNGTVTEYAPGSTKAIPGKTFASSLLLSAAAVALDARGNVYVADNGHETVTRFPAKGKPVTWFPGWEAGADVIGVAVDARRNLLDIVMSGAGDFYPPKATRVGRIASLPLTFTSAIPVTFTIDSKRGDGVDEPYGIAVDGAGNAFVVDDYVSIVEGPPGPGPEYSTLTRYSGGVNSSASRPDATASANLAWPLSVAVDVAGTVYVADNTPPSASSQPGRIWLMQYDGADIAKPAKRVNLSKGMPAAYGPYYLNVQGIAVEPSPLR